MKTTRLIQIWLLIVAASFFGWLPANAQTQEQPWKVLFNGRDLSGWKNVNTAADTWQVRDGMIVCTGTPRGFIRTEHAYQNYVLEYEWRHVQHGGNAGVMIHADPLPQVGAPYPKSVEIQAMDGDHGSMFGIRGCTIRPLTNPVVRGNRPRAQPIENRAQPAGQWNHYRLVSRDGELELAVNGKVVSRASDASQVRGYICLEAERSEVHYRNLRIRELPDSDVMAGQTAPQADDFQSIFDGLTFAGWKYHDDLKQRWEVEDGVIRLRADQPPREPRVHDLETNQSFRNFELIVDWRLIEKPKRQSMKNFTADGLIQRDDDGRVVMHMNESLWG